MAKVRTQRKLIKTLKDKEVITSKVYRNLYNKVRGNFFRSRRHIKIYLEEHNLTKKWDTKEKDKEKQTITLD